MEMAYREQWKAEIAAMRRVLAGLAMTEECKWGKPTYHGGWKEHRHHAGLQGVLRAGLLSGRPAEGSQEGAGAARPGTGRARDEVHQRERNHGEGGDHQGLRARGHRSREGWAADEAEEDLGFSGSRGVERAVPKGPAFQARLRGADAGAAEELPLPLCGGQAVGDADGANRKGDARDLRRQRVPGEDARYASTRPHRFLGRGSRGAGNRRLRRGSDSSGNRRRAFSGRRDTDLRDIAVHRRSVHPGNGCPALLQASRSSVLARTRV